MVSQVIALANSSHRRLRVGNYRVTFSVENGAVAIMLVCGFAIGEKLMTNRETITISRAECDALVAQNAELEDYVAAPKADDGSRIPHPVALAIIRGDSPLSAFRSYRRLTLRGLSQATGLAPSYISEIERGVKPGSVSALARLADALDTTIDALAIESAE